MAPIAEPPAVGKVEIEHVHRKVNGKVVGTDYVIVKNLPGGAPGAAGLITCRYDHEHEQRELFFLEQNRQVYWRSWRIETHFKGTPGFPEGVPVGVEVHHTDTGVGTPFEESSHYHCGLDGYERLRAHAHGLPCIAMHERRRIDEESRQWRAERRVTQGQNRDTTRSPAQILEGVADDRLLEKIGAKIEAEVEKRVAAALAKPRKGGSE